MSDSSQDSSTSSTRPTAANPNAAAPNLADSGNISGWRQIREFNDRGTLWLLEDPVCLRDLLQILAPDLAARLDITRTERVNRSFIPADLRKEESDLIFRIAYRTDDAEAGTSVLIYVLLEHQSRPDPLMGLRLLSYMMQLWESQRREAHDANLPASQVRLSLVVPVVFYTGVDTWDTLPGLSSLLDAPPALSRFVPTWDILFLNLHNTNPADLTRFSTAVGYALRVLQAEREPFPELEQVLNEAMTGLEGLGEGQGGQWLRVAWYFLLLVHHRRSRQEFPALLQTVQERARASKFHERTDIDTMITTMAQELEARGEARAEARMAAMAQELEARGEARAEARMAAMAQELEARGEARAEARMAAMAQELEARGEARAEARMAAMAQELEARGEARAEARMAAMAQELEARGEARAEARMATMAQELEARTVRAVSRNGFAFAFWRYPPRCHAGVGSGGLADAANVAAARSTGRHPGRRGHFVTLPCGLKKRPTGKMKA